MFETPTTSDNQPPRQRSAVAVTVDNLLRRRLRVSNPRSATDIAEGLRRTFVAASAALQREASGLPIARELPVPASRALSGPSSTEVDQATGDVTRDMQALLNNSQLKDIEAELDGWSQAIRVIVDDGLAAARFALDPRARDRALGARRQLGDYARMARMIGALTPTLSPPYRRLAQSLDVIASLILVTAGEALASLGMGSGRALLPAPASELTARRDAVLAALRNLTGATETAFDQKTWPYGLHGLREVLRRLEASGHADLRALLEEGTLAHVLDDLVDRGSTMTPRKLRALGATAQVTVQQLQRLISVLNTVIQSTDPETPPVASFLESLQLLVDGFAPDSGGYRLLFVARPPLVFYGLYGISGPDLATRRLLDVVSLRGRLAELLDCYLGCDCCASEVICQIILDKLLYDTDRAIDLLIIGADPNGDGEPERRAAAYGWLIAQYLANDLGCLARACSPSLTALPVILRNIATLLLQIPLPRAGGNLANLNATHLVAEAPVMQNELCLQSQSEQRWQNLVTSMAPSCTTWNAANAPIATLLGAAIAGLNVGGCPPDDISIPPTPETSLSGLASLRLTSGQRTFTLAEQKQLRILARRAMGLPP